MHEMVNLANDPNRRSNVLTFQRFNVPRITHHVSRSSASPVHHIPRFPFEKRSDIGNSGLHQA
jgi:hypothetical protein